MVSEINQPGQKPFVPQEIAKAMKDKGIKTLSALATKCGLTAMTVRRLFLPNHHHRMLIQYMRWCTALDLSMEQLFSICLDNDPDEAGNLLAERISERGFTLSSFSKEIGGTSRGVGMSVYHYLNGDADYQSMRIYRSVSTELGITADNLANIIATTFRVLHTTQTSDKVLESRATTYEKTTGKRSEKSYLLRNTRWPRI